MKRITTSATVLAALTVIAATPAAYATGLYLTSGSTTVNDNTYQNRSIYVGRDKSLGTTSGGVPYVATLNVVAGGIVNNAIAYNTSTINISGGIVSRLVGNNSSQINISGGTLPNGFLLSDTTAKVDFVGSGLSFAYQSYGNNNPTGEFADFFTVSGSIGGAANTSYNLYIRNAAGATGVANNAARGFTFNGAAPAVVPEAGTLALLLPALGIVGVTVAVLSRKGVVKIKRNRRVLNN